MGNYLNPGNSGFSEIRNSKFVDKSGMIRLINEAINTKQKLICVSRPRRFGKSYAAQMLCAYYDKSCDSSSLFDDLRIAADDEINETYRNHLNKYDVIYLDMASMIGSIQRDIVSFMKRSITEELKDAYPDLKISEAFHDTLANAVELTGNKFIVIIDEWDAPIRELPAIQKEYLQFLRALFKNSGTTGKTFAAAYMTGILPIKKDGTESAISDFQEYTILNPGPFAEYTGFTETEVKMLCDEYDMNFEDAKIWYDGYSLQGKTSVYNPYSIMCAMRQKRFRSYWRKTSAAESLITYIDMDEEGLQNEIARLITGESVEVDTEGFENDFESLRCKDDVLTLLIHLGYLTYEEDQLTVYARIPNEEIRMEFNNILRKGRHTELIRLVRISDQLLKDTIDGKEDAVASAIERVHDTRVAPAFYNQEHALRYTVKMAYISCVDQYLNIEELPSGHGYADVVFIPKRRSPLPAMIVELKWNKAADGAIEQIKDRNYPARLKDYGGEILLVGVSYDEKTKEHTCHIEKYG